MIMYLVLDWFRGYTQLKLMQFILQLIFIKGILFYLSCKC